MQEVTTYLVYQNDKTDGESHTNLDSPTSPYWGNSIAPILAMNARLMRERQGRCVMKA